MSATTVSRARSAAPRRTATRGAPAVPRRVSGPVGGRARVAPRPQQGGTAGARALALVRSLPDHSLIDRLVRGRAWIPVLGVLLVGIVAMQVEILKVGTSLGRSLERTASLQSQNESLQAGVAGLADYQRIERLASGMGMATPSPGLLTFTPSHPRSQTRLGLANIHAPDPVSFATELAAQVAAAELIAPSGTQSTAASGSASSAGVAASTSSGTSSASPVTSSTTAPSGASSAGTGSTGVDGVGTGTSTAGGPTSTTTSGAGSTTGAPTSAVTPVSGGGVSAGAAGLPATSGSQSGSPSGG